MPSNEEHNQSNEETQSESNYREIVGTALFELIWFRIDVWLFMTYRICLPYGLDM